MVLSQRPANVRVAIKIGISLGLLLLAISGPAYAQSNAPPVITLPPARGPCADGEGLIFMYDATLVDDGIPGPARVSWEQLDGPALVRFNDRNVVQATMCVPQAGVYSFRMLADDGELLVSEDILVTVLPLPINSAQR